MRSLLCFLIVAATTSECVRAFETPLQGGSSTTYETRADPPPGTAATDHPGALKVALATFGPGQRYWERFGHNALIVDDAAAGTRIIYNYGVFDFHEQHFLLNFARGRMRYSLVAEPLQADLASYVAEGRSVTVQLLNLTPLQARQLAVLLAENAQPENAGYAYDYFINNCSTKVRDALNRALGGALERELAHRAAPHTYRFDAVRLMSADYWLGVGMDFLLGPSGDRPLSLWQETFAPPVLSRVLDTVSVRGTNGDALPLVSDEEIVAPGRLPPAPLAPPDLRLTFLAAGSGLAALMLLLARGRTRISRASFAVLAVAWWLVCGCFGLLLAALWGLSEHWAIWRNENLLLADPLCLVLPLIWWRAPRIASGLTILVAAVALSSLILRTLPSCYQGNLVFIALAAPVHVALAALAWRERGASDSAPAVRWPRTAP